jgi:hypothetical protein
VFANLRLRRSKIPENCECPTPEKHISRTSLKLDVSRVTGFPEFPNRAFLLSEVELIRVGSIVAYLDIS